MDLATQLSGSDNLNMGSAQSPAQQTQQTQQQQQQSASATAVSPLRPAPIAMTSSHMTLHPLPAANYYNSSAPQFQHNHHGESKVKFTTNTASGNGLGGNDSAHKSGGNDQTVTDHQAREILRVAVVSAGLTEQANAVAKATGGAVAGVANALSKAAGGIKPGVVRYGECHKNHAALLGGHSLDGCGEFIPRTGDGDDGLRCAACDCHRNFHRREVEGEVCDCSKQASALRAKLNHNPNLNARAGSPRPLASSVLATLTPNQQISSLAMAATPTDGAPTDSDDLDDLDDTPTGTPGTGMPMHLPHGRSPTVIQKRFRTKFSTEQKDKMCEFATKLGWRIQKHDEAAVHDFCTTVGVKRHVLKVWMHNNKNTIGKIVDKP